MSHVQSLVELPQFDDKFIGISPDLSSLLLQLLTFDPRQRPTAKELLKNPMFDGFRNKKLEKGVPHNFHIAADIDHPFDYENFVDITPIEILIGYLGQEIKLVEEMRKF
jgi:serine/threonine protein kinase